MFNFKNLKEFMAFFSDEKTCWDYLEKKFWNGKPICPHCGCDKVYRLANYKQFKCGNYKGCDKKFTVLVGTVMENTKIPLSTWFMAIYLTTSHKKGISSLQLHRDLGITQKTAWFLLHRIREMVKPHNEIQLSGTVAVDETYVKGMAINRTKNEKRKIAIGERIDEAAVVIGMVEPKGNAILSVVNSAETDSLKQAINKTVDDKSTIIVTDAYYSYRSIGLEYGGHIIVNHSIGEYANAGYSTNAAEGAFSWFKRTYIGTYHYMSPKHLERYCQMFNYRYNTRKFSEPLRFDTTMSQLKGRITYKKLIANFS